MTDNFLRHQALARLGCSRAVNDAHGVAQPAADSLVKPSEAQIQAKTAELAGPTIDDVRAEAERRLSDGILVNGGAFKADDPSRQRLAELIAHMEASPGLRVTFFTAAGVRFSWSDAAHPKAVAAAVARYVIDVLAASAKMQADPPDDVMNNPRWPRRPEVVIPI